MSAGMDMSQTEIHVLFTRFASKITAIAANGRNDCVRAYRYLEFFQLYLRDTCRRSTECGKRVASRRVVLRAAARHAKLMSE